MRVRSSDAGVKPVGFLYAAFAACALACFADASAADTWGNARILNFEPFVTTIDPRPALAQKPTNTRQLKFDANGRRFDLTLEPNEKLQRARPTNPGSVGVNLYRGELTGLPGSWARIATRGADVHGLIWDGSELYVIEPMEAVRDSIVAPLDPGSAQTIVFRLADTILDPGTSMCAVSANEAEAVTGSEAYKSLAREFDSLKRGAVIMQNTLPGLRLELAAIGDAQFRAQFSSDAEAIEEMLLRLNNVDGIYSAQLGVEIQVPTTIVYDGSSEPFSATTSATRLLENLRDLRNGSAELRSRGLTHLFTGRDLDGLTVGIGYVGTLCSNKFGAALTEIRGRGAWLESLITAHEIGHNFGANHDGGDECSAVQQNQFLMSPTVHAAKATFSSCSRDVMLTKMMSASCITTLPPADLAVPADLGTVRMGIARSFEWDLSVSNAGGRAAQQSRVELLVPPSLTITEAWVAGGTCTSGAGAVNCELGDVSGSASRVVHLTLSGTVAGSNTITTKIASLTDARLSNNNGEGTIVIEPEIDLAVTLDAPVTVNAGASFSVSFGLTNRTALAGDAEVRFVLPSYMSATAVSVPSGICTLQPSIVCSFRSFGANASATGTLTLIAAKSGSGDITARAKTQHLDPDGSNDLAVRSIQAISEPATQNSAAAPIGGQDGGGGGAMSFMLLTALSGLGVLRRVRRYLNTRLNARLSDNYQASA